MRHGQFKKPLSIAVREKTYSSIKTLSESKKVSMGDVVRGILESHFENIELKEVKNV